MTLHDISYLLNHISFNKALLMIAERLFLSQRGKPEKWQRWMKSLDTPDVETHGLLPDQEQLAKQDKDECNTFLMEESAKYMREMLLSNSPPAYIKAEKEELFRVKPSYFEDEKRLSALAAQDRSVTAPVARCCPVLGSWENAYNYTKRGRLVFLSREVESALNDALPLTTVGNDNCTAHQLRSQPVLNLPEPTLVG